MPRLRQVANLERATAKKAWELSHRLTIMAEFIESTERLSVLRPAVSIFGAARIGEGHATYALTMDIARRLSDAGLAVISGGGPGLMEVANKGAYAGPSASLGLNIELPREQKSNGWQNVSMSFQHFFARKVAFVKYADAHVVLPGGFGTLDELTELLTLIQTGKSRRIPVILVGTTFWRGLLEWFRSALLAEGMIHAKDLELVQMIDEPANVVDAICAFCEARQDLEGVDSERETGAYR